MTDELYEVEFLKYEPLAGFVGYEDSQITGIGFYRYMCANRPEGLGPNGEPLDPNTTGGEVEPIVVTDPTDPVTPPTSGNLDPEKETICEDGDAECVTQPELKEEDSSSKLTTILIILLGVLVGLVLVLCIIVYLFRKSKKTAV